MAAIIDVPGIGKIEVENFATEDTLRKILELTKASTKKTNDENKDTAKNAKAANEGLKDLGDTTKDVAKLAEDAAAKTSKSTASFNKSMSNAVGGMTTLKNTFKTSVDAMGKFTKDMFSNADAIAKNPIAASSKMLNAGIDAAAGAAIGLTKVVSGTVAGLVSFVPLIGTALASLINGFGEAAAATISFAADLAKIANKAFAEEFEKSTRALTKYTAQGASFANGMSEMRIVAHSAGLGIEALADIAAKAGDDIRSFGLSQGDGTKLLASAIGKTVTQIGKSGTSLRDEMMRMGYSYEDQGAIMANFMSIQRSAGKELSNLGERDLDQFARGAREYAANLKVLSDFTGQDAKKLMIKASNESKRAGMIGTLKTPEEQANFNNFYSMLEGSPELQQALMQKKSTGVITNSVAASPELTEMINKMVAGMGDNVSDAMKMANESMARATEKIAASPTAKAIGTADLLSPSTLSGVAKELSSLNDKMLQRMISGKEIGQSQAALAGQVSDADGLGQSYANLTAMMNKNAIAVEKLVGDNLPAYARLLETTAKQFTDTFQDAVAVINGTMDKEVAAMRAMDRLAGRAEKIEDVGETLIRKAAGLDANASPMEMNVARQEMSGSNMGFANGGVTTGSPSGHFELLHGTEAVVPLPDGNTIPVSINTPPDIVQIKETLAQLMQLMATPAVQSSTDTETMKLLASLLDAARDNIDKQDQMLRVMADNRDNTERLYHAMS